MTGARQNLRSLQVFEAVYRHSSIAGAAKELNITPSAVSHQLKKLTDFVGEKILEREGRRIVFTEAGRDIAENLGAAFAQIDSSVTEKGRRSASHLRIAACSSFLTGCLIPRFSKFSGRNRSPEVIFSLCANEMQVADSSADIMITTWPLGLGYWSHALFEERLIPVASAQNLKSDASVSPLITTDIQPGSVGQEWIAYHKELPLPGTEVANRSFILCSHYIIALAMANNGFGLALIPDYLAADDLEKGDLIAVGEPLKHISRTYYLSIKDSRRENLDVLAWANWFVSEFGRPHPVRGKTPIRTPTIP